MGQFIAAFLAGIASFASPCILPLIPAYLSFVSGVSFQELSAGVSGSWRKVFGSTALFVLGFSLIFTLLGATASRLGQAVQQYQGLLVQIGGVLVILMGLLFIGVAKVPILQQERRFHLVTRPAGVLGPILVGMAFAFGWTPCIAGFALTILSYAADSKTVFRGAALLLTYSLGLGIPLVVTSLAFTKALDAFNWIKRHYSVVVVISGLLMILMGILLVAGKMSLIQGLMAR